MKGNILNIAPLLKKGLKNRIARVGIELEGGWEKLPEGVRLVRDGSIQGLDPGVPPDLQRQIDAVVERINHERRTATTATANAYHLRMVALNKEYEGLLKLVPRMEVGELPSPPMEVAKVPLWVKQYYPSHVNASCGLHVHMSFLAARHYSLLMTPDYQRTIVSCLMRWAKEVGLKEGHPFWPRVQGKNRFCKFDFFPDAQITSKNKAYTHEGEGNRYTAINYCYGLHETLECRLLPMFETAEEAIAAIQVILATTNACLLYLGRKEERERATLVLGDGDDTLRESRPITI